MVQPDQRLWLHPAFGGRTGRVRAYLGGGAGWPQHAQRKSGRGVRDREQSRQELGREPESKVNRSSRRLSRRELNRSVIARIREPAVTTSPGRPNGYLTVRCNNSLA